MGRYIDKIDVEFYYKKLTHTIMKVDKSQDLQSPN